PGRAPASRRPRATARDPPRRSGFHNRSGSRAVRRRARPWRDYRGGVLFGAHCPGGIKKAIDAAEGMGADVVQLFAQSPRAWRFPNHDPETFQKFRERRAESGLAGAFVHALYLINLAAPDKAIYKKSVETMRATMAAACAIEADGVIFHVGSHLGAGFDAGLKRVAPALAQVLDRCSEPP